MTHTITLSLAAALLIVTSAGCEGSDKAPNKTPGHDASGHASDHGPGAHPTGTQAAASAKPKEARVVAIDVGNTGFKPNKVETKKGEKVTLRFTRTSKDTCATKVVFADAKIEKELPLNKAVDVEVPTDTARTLAFQCGMGMLKGSVLVR